MPGIGLAYFVGKVFSTYRKAPFFGRQEPDRKLLLKLVGFLLLLTVTNVKPGMRESHPIIDVHPRKDIHVDFRTQGEIILTALHLPFASEQKCIPA